MNLFYFSAHEDRKVKDGAGTRSFFILQSMQQHFSQSISVTKRELFINTSLWPIGFLRPLAFSRWITALKTLVNRKNYMENKHVGLIHFYISFLFCNFFTINYIYLHFIWTFPLVRPFVRHKRLIIDTHNFEPTYWDNFKNHSKSFLEKKICEISKKRTIDIYQTLPKKSILIHVSPEDSQYYQKLRPDLTHLVLPNGCNFKPRVFLPTYSDQKKKIYFLGSLGLYATKKALFYFSERFWPSLREFCEFYLLGSGNKMIWDAFCRRHAWNLKSNLSDNELAEITSRMHYCVLPFNFASGSKLKFIDACARGVPVISTTHGVTGFTNLPPTVRISEDPGQWASWISSPQGPTDAETAACLAFAKEYSWDNLVAKIWPQIQSHPPVP